VRFAWRDFHHLGYILKDLPERSLQEALLRTSIGRSYYAAYGTASEYACANLGFDPKHSASDHRRLRDCLKAHARRSGDCSSLVIAQHLDRLRRWRNQCDYYMALKCDIESTCREALSRTAKILQMLSG